MSHLASYPTSAGALRHVLLATVCACALLLAASPGRAADPASGSLDPVVGDQVEWVGTSPGGVSPGPFLGDHEDFCDDGVTCEFYELELTGAVEDWDGAAVRVFFRWLSPSTDYDVYVHAGAPDGPVIDDSATGPTNFERIDLDPAEHGTGLFYFHVVYFAATAADQYSGEATVVATSQGLPPAPIDTGLPPRYQTHTPTADQIAAGMTRNSQDEPNIGVNWQSEQVILQALLQTLKVDFDDDVCPQTPSSSWLDISPPTAVTSFDPILFTDHETHRTFVSHLLLNPFASATSFTDNDGVSWTPSQGAGPGSGIDHQTLGGGPFAQPAPPTTTGYPNAVYYCAQDIAFANCALSLDGGITFGPAIPMYHLEQCAGLHGHVKVAPDGTVYVPNAECFGTVNPNENAVAVSEDNGLTWEVRTVPGTVGSGGSDPSVAIDSAGTLYLGFVDGDRIPAVAVSTDRGRTWQRVYEVGSMVGIQNAVFPAMVAGDPGRAAMAFYGTTASGNANLFDSEGAWHLYVAHTYDDGQSWITVQATPDDPLQRGGIHLGGGSQIHRNLLDFFDADHDPQGRVVVGYADGCIDACVEAPADARGNSYTAYGKIARQSGGRRLIAAHDPAEPTLPGAPYLTVTRNGALATLAWSLSEDGGSPVTSFDVHRTEGGGPERKIATVDGSTRVFHDLGSDQVTYTYRVVATNAQGDSCGTNAVTAEPKGSSCVAPGIRVATDAAGDNDTAPADPDMDIEWIAIGEPFFEDGSQKLVFTMKVASLDPMPADRMWRILWEYPDAPVAPNPTDDGFVGRYYIGMDTDGGGVPSFEYGIVTNLTAVVANALPPVRLGDADPESTVSPDGTITLVISTGKIGGAHAGDLVGGLLGRTYPVRQNETLRSDSAADSATDSETYQLVGNGFCEDPPQPPPPVPAAGRVHGAGWLDGLGDGDKKIDFSFDGRVVEGELKGKIMLHDNDMGIKIKAHEVTGLAAGGALCNGVATSAERGFEVTAKGDLNGAAAEFRVCGEDNTTPGKHGDRFFLECISGCSYDTADRSPDDGIDGGNIHLHEAIGSGGGSGGSEPQVLELDPMLLSEALAGQPVTLTALVAAPEGAGLEGVGLTLRHRGEDGSTGSTSAATDALGVAVFVVTVQPGETAYWVESGGLESNRVVLTGGL